VGSADPEGKLRGQVSVGDAANTVGSKE